MIHSRAFRRLEYKTQVFVNHEGDHYRTRLTHSIEVCQIGRTVARALALNEDLVEVLALSHDLGHTPFGHLGEEVLDRILREHGGFNHNRQTLRIVEILEDRYSGFPGLNLTWEVREGIAKHSGAIDVARAPEFAEYEPDRQPPLEGQMIDLVDEIAYNHHDIDDGLESGLMDSDALAEAVPIFGRSYEEAGRVLTRATPRQRRTHALRGTIDRLVSDLVQTTEANIRASGVRSTEDVRNAGMLVALSEEVAGENRALKLYLREHLYRHPRIESGKEQARMVLSSIFERYAENPELLPEPNRPTADEASPKRRIADYVAGMTDRYAIEEYRRLVDPDFRA